MLGQLCVLFNGWKRKATSSAEKKRMYKRMKRKNQIAVAKRIAPVISVVKKAIKKEKKKGAEIRKSATPQRMTEINRYFKNRITELETQEAKLFMRFLHDHPEIDATLNTAETIWTFLRFLKKLGYHIIDGRTVFCFPFDRLVKFKNLK